MACPWVLALLVALAPASADEVSVFPKPVCVRFGSLGWEFVLDDNPVAWKVAREESGWIAVGKSSARWSPRAHVFAPRDAEACYSEVLARSPDAFVARRRRAAARMKLGDDSGGIADYRALMESGSADVTDYIALGGYLGEQGDRSRARDTLSRCITMFPDEPLAYVLRARFAAQDGDSHSALADLQRAADLASKDPGRLLMVAAAAMEQDQFELAARVLTSVIKQEPDEAYLYEVRALVQFARGAPEEVARDVESALQRGASGAKLWKIRGCSYLATSKWGAAAEDFSRVLELDPTDSDARRLRA